MPMLLLCHKENCFFFPCTVQQNLITHANEKSIVEVVETANLPGIRCIVHHCTAVIRLSNGILGNAGNQSENVTDVASS